MDREWVVRVAAAIKKKSRNRPGSECQIWTGYKRKCKGQRGGGYGIMNVRMPDSDSRTTMRVHRLAYIVHTGKFIPQELDVSHLCHNSLCVNVHHLSLEPHCINNARKFCRKHKACQGHGEYGDCIL